ncbi:T9SS type A sorting domain-containing protein [Neolewinella sp.]|uniref:T9SS type A sorting domain-containing protein n=1 Tax=Neolewinella sp. TaxID=2993543 RepID=UPI003B51B0E8
MLRIATLLALLLTALPAIAQITITEAYFPAAGDTLRYGVSDSATTIDLLNSGADRQWDFGTQTAVDTQLQIIRSYDDNPAFSNADVVMAIDSANVGYYAITDTTYELVGIRGMLTDVLPGFEYNAPVTPGRAQRRAPLAYQDRYVSTTVNTIAVDVDSLPDEAVDALDEFGPLLDGIDSIRIVSTSARTDVVDAYGTLIINGQSYEVLRERRNETNSAEVLVKTGGIELPVTGVILEQRPDLGDFLGEQDPIITYYYWTNTEKEAVAIVTVDEFDAPTSLLFIQGDVTNSVRGPQLTQAQVRVYPNPARDLTTFEAAGLESGGYTLRVVNMLGREVIRQQLTSVDGRVRTEVNVSQLPRGPYIYSMTNERGRILTTRRLLVNR